MSCHGLYVKISCRAVLFVTARPHESLGSDWVRGAGRGRLTTIKYHADLSCGETSKVVETMRR